jgi:hypothetical protein
LSGKDNTHFTKVHADSSNFSEGVSKSDAYKQVLEQAEALFDGQDNWVRCMYDDSQYGIDVWQVW